LRSNGADLMQRRRKPQPTWRRAPTTVTASPSRRASNDQCTETGKPEDQRTLREVWDDREQEGRGFWQQMEASVETLDGLLCKNDALK